MRIVKKSVHRMKPAWDSGETVPKRIYRFESFRKLNFEPAAAPPYAVVLSGFTGQKYSRIQLLDSSVIHCKTDLNFNLKKRSFLATKYARTRISDAEISEQGLIESKI